MRNLILLVIAFFIGLAGGNSQDAVIAKDYKKHGVVWTAGLFKSWLTDEYVGFNKIGSQVSPIFEEQKKMGFCVHSHYMYKPNNWMGVGIHLGMGLDVNSFIEAPVVLFGLSVSLGSDHQFVIDFGWADGKRRKVPGGIRDQLEISTYTEIPEIYTQTELNTGYYISIGYRIY